MKNKKAFSLIEAMIILLLISVGIMALVPLITQKTHVPMWRVHRIPAGEQNAGAIDAVVFGDANSSSQRIGIGNGVNPYTADTNAKVAVQNLTIGNNAGNNIIQGGTFDNNGAYARYAIVPNNSTIIGMNSCNNAPTGSTIIRSLAAAADDDAAADTCENNSTAIGTNSASNAGVLNINNSVTVTDDEITIGNLTVDKNNNNTVTINGTLTVNGYLIPSAYIKEAESDKDKGDENNNSVKFFREEENEDSDTYYRWFTEDYSWQYNLPAEDSDRRLKNVKGAYTKGLAELEKINTYLFSFKSDSKKRIHAGIIAQKLIGIFDEALHKDADGFYSYEKSPLFYAMVNSVQSIAKKQDDIMKNQKEMNDKLDELIRKYE